MRVSRFVWVFVAATALTCGGGGPPPIDDSLPKTGRYLSVQYTEQQIQISRDVVYSTRANEGDQFTTDITDTAKSAEQQSAQLSLALDIFTPPNAATGSPQPTIIFIHGGSALSGNKEDHRSDALSYARAGYVAASINYRLTPHNPKDAVAHLRAIAQAAEDAMNAVRFLRSHATEYFVDASRICV